MICHVERSETSQISFGFGAKQAKKANDQRFFATLRMTA